MIEQARKFLERLEADAPAARTAADRGNAEPLATLVERALTADLRDAQARKDLPRDVLDRVEAWLRAPLRVEASLRGGLAAARARVGNKDLTLEEAMRAYRAPDEGKRKAAQDALEKSLEALLPSLEELTNRLAQAPKPPPPSPNPTATKPAPLPKGALVLPNAELIQALTTGAPLDPIALAALAESAATLTPSPRAVAGAPLDPIALARLAESAATLTPSPRAVAKTAPIDASTATAPQPSETRASAQTRGAAPAIRESAATDPRPSTPTAEPPHADRIRFSFEPLTRETASPPTNTNPPSDRTERSPTTTTHPALRDLLHTLADALRSPNPPTHHAWKSTAAATHLASFHPSADLTVLKPITNFTKLPFEQPLTPLARDRALIAPAGDATSMIAHLFGVPSTTGHRALGAALALTAQTQPFLRRAMKDAPSDPIAAARALALTTLLNYVEADLTTRATTLDELLDHYQDTLQTTPARSLARYHLLEPALAAAPGEHRALYAHTIALRDLTLTGLSLAETLRNTFDEDWFRNPKLTPDLLDRQAAEPRTPAPPSHLATWLREHARL